MSEENKIIEGSVVVLKSDADNEHKIKMTVEEIIKRNYILKKDLPEHEWIASVRYFNGGILLKQEIRLTSLHKIS